MAYKEIRAVYDDETIRVYQAYCPEIAEEAVSLGRFGSRFGLNRMTWIKPSFLWMMYRCGWGEKEGQERILAIDIKRSAFDHIVKNAVVSSYREDMGMTLEEWKRLVRTSEIRVQWDPERDIYGSPLEYRSIQLGLRGEAVKNYVKEWIVKLTDITEEVREMKRLRDNGADISEKLPREMVYRWSEE